MRLSKIALSAILGISLSACAAAKAVYHKNLNLDEIAADPEALTEYKDASFYEKVLEKNPDDWKAHLDLAEACMQKIGGMDVEFGKNAKKAVAHFEASIKLKPNESAYFHLGELYDLLGKNRKAIQTHKKAAELWPDDPETLKHLAQSYRSSRQHKKAIEVLERIISLDSAKTARYYELRKNSSRQADDQDCYSLLADDYTQIGNYEKALEYADKVIANLPNSAFVYIDRASIYEKKKEYEKALEDYRIAMQMNPQEDYQKKIGLLEKKMQHKP